MIIILLNFHLRLPTRHNFNCFRFVVARLIRLLFALITIYFSWQTIAFHQFHQQFAICVCFILCLCDVFFFRLGSFPDRSCHFPPLLQIPNNQITSFPLELCELNQLRKLDLRFNPIKRLPSAIGQMTSLAELMVRIIRFYHFSTIFSTLFQLEQTGLRELPPEIGSLKSLTMLAVRKHLTIFVRIAILIIF